jgi:hypothetical protein
MRSSILLAVAVGMALMASASANCRMCNEHPSDFAHFRGWMNDHNKTYASPEDQAVRFAIFRDSMTAIAKLNTNPANSAKYGLTKFADLTADEFKEQYLMSQEDSAAFQMKWAADNLNNFPPRADKAAQDMGISTVDWRHILTPIKNQGQCGSCWAFSTTETVETQAVVQNVGKWILSSQQITACADGQWGNAGCQGGLPSQAFTYLESNALTTASNYPYTAGGGPTGSCQNPSGNGVVKVSSQKPACSPGDETTLGSQLQQSPISIGVDAQAWQFYTGGVMNANECGGTQLDHAVQLVGYSANQGGYWIVRNSWTASWGESGFIYLTEGENTCGLSNTAVSIEVQSA